MRIGVLTFYREINFGANIQALSTYYYLKGHGHDPIFINYSSKEKEELWGPLMENEPQPHCHRDFIDNTIADQTEICRNVEDINQAIKKYDIDRILVGSDAVLQHHPLRDRFVFSRKRLFKVRKAFPDTSFPNPFWGVGIDKDVKMALMSASSQDSEYNHFSGTMKKEMKDTLCRFTYLSVRDTWTQNMLISILGDEFKEKIKVTPDPVFNFNENAAEYIPDKTNILKKYGLPSKYVLISLFGQHLSMQSLKDLKDQFQENGIACVALPMQLGYLFKHPFDYEIPVPLIPTDWYALIKYSMGYIGNNMHPVVVALHNAVPCYSLDFYGVRDFWGKPKKEISSKIYHILKEFGVESNYRIVVRGKCEVMAQDIVSGIMNFPITQVKKVAERKSFEYNQMMNDILNSWNSIV